MALFASDTLRNAWCDAITTALGTSGLIKIYDGSVPASEAAALSGNTLLGTLTLSATAAPAASGGVWTASSITSDSSADATGTATFFRATTSGGTVVLQGAVSTSGAELNLSSTSITLGQPIAVTSFTITAPH